MAEVPRLITAQKLDAMSPSERATVMREHVVPNLDQLSDEFRRRVEATAGRIANSVVALPTSEFAATSSRRLLVLRSAR